MSHDATVALGTAGFDTPSRHHRALFGMWLFLASEIMFFSGFIGAYIALKTATPGAHEDANQLNWVIALVNTVVLIVSSLTMALAVAASKRGDNKQLKLFLVLTIVLACAFLGIKTYEYIGKFSHGIGPQFLVDAFAPAGTVANMSPFFSAYFCMTGFHGLHVIGGIIAIGYWAKWAFQNKFTAEYNIPIETTGLYWHFVDIVWIFLFPMLYLIK